MNEKKDLLASVPLPHVVAGREAPAPRTTFRGRPIEWVEVVERKTIVTPAAFGEDDVSEVPSNKQHFIHYDGRLYTRVEFLKYAFQEYRKYPYRVKFKKDDIFRLGGNQQAKLLYHILAQRFPLVYVSEQDKADLERFCENEDTETAQRWLNRIRWPQGLEKIVTFGVGLKVEGKVNGVWCYFSQIGNQKAHYIGVSMTWEAWARSLTAYLDEQRLSGSSPRTIGEGAMM